MATGSPQSTRVAESKFSLATRAWRLTGSFALVLSAGTLLTLVGTTTPATAAGNVTPSIYVANYDGNNNLTFPSAPAATSRQP